MKSILDYCKRRWYVVLIVTALVLGNLYVWMPIIRTIIYEITLSSFIALVLSVISIIITYRNYRFNRKLGVLQRYNYAIEKYYSVETTENNLKYLLSNMVTQNKYTSFQAQLNVCSKHMEDIRTDFIFKYFDNLEELRYLEVEKFIAKVNILTMSLGKLNTVISVYNDMKKKYPENVK